MTEKLTQLYLPKGEWLNAILSAFKKADLEITAPPRCYEYKFVSSSIPIIFEAIRSKEVWSDISDQNTTANGGFTGSDIAIEQAITSRWTFPLYNLQPEDEIFPRPKIILGSTPNFKQKFDQPEIKNLDGKTIYTSYPKITQDFFDNNQTKVKIVEKQGAIEGRWRTNLDNWAIVDVVNSGDTLKANQIEIMQEILPAQIVYVENQNMNYQDKLRIDCFREQLYIASNIKC
jgi:ATP phosphoribosyltransferase